MGLFSRRKTQEPKGVDVEEGWPVDAPNGFVVFDFETTGLSPASNRILEIGLIRVDASGRPLGYWSSLVNPQGPVGATHVHGIKDGDVANAPTFDDLVDDLLPKLHGQVLVAHNAKFDHSFLRAELGRAGWSLPDVPVVCTMVESKNFLPGLDRRRLSDCADAIGIRQDVEHRALGDASLATAILHFYLNGPVNRSRSAQLSLLPKQAAGIPWPSEPGERITPKALGQRPRRTTSPVRLDLLEAVSEVLPEDLLGDSPTTPELSYANLLLSSLDDGIISEAELLGLSECADIFGLGSEFVKNVHVELLRAVAREAWRDGVVSRNEQQEVVECAQRLGIDESVAKQCIREVEELRVAKVGAQSKPVPAGWEHGEPLKIGDRVVITGCYDHGREELENRARRNGLKIIGSVSGKTTLLVSDGSVGGNKDNDAQRLGIRVVHPEVFRDLLEYVQPSLVPSAEVPSISPTSTSNIEPDVRTEILVCITCGQSFQRVISRGRKPHECEGCRAL